MKTDTTVIGIDDNTRQIASRHPFYSTRTGKVLTELAKEQMILDHILAKGPWKTVKIGRSKWICLQDLEMAERTVNPDARKLIDKDSFPILGYTTEVVLYEVKPSELEMEGVAPTLGNFQIICQRLGILASPICVLPVCLDYDDQPAGSCHLVMSASLDGQLLLGVQSDKLGQVSLESYYCPSFMGLSEDFRLLVSIPKP